MKKPKLGDLKSEASEIYATYQSNFAGKPRATRDPALLESLIERLESLVENARLLLNGGRNPAVMSMIDTASDNLERYDEELKAIRDAQKHPYNRETAELATRANRIFDQYHRHFAGKDRGTRDLGILTELTEELEYLREKIEALADDGIEAAEADLETVDTQLETYREERHNIERARNSGSSEEIASRLAHLANEQFGWYANHFANMPRTTRRPRLLERMIQNLENYRDAMQNLMQTGYRSEQNAQNIRTVQSHLETYRAELGEIRSARDQVSRRDLAGMLGGSANDVMGEYKENFAGKDRRSRDLELLSVLCDRLAEIERQMRALHEETPYSELSPLEDEEGRTMNEKNLGIVTESLATYELEYKRIEEAQNGA